VRQLSHYWEEVRALYAAFESEERAGASEVYVHGMPGGQYTNLREQARALGIGDHWPEVARAYAEVNEMFGDIVKVTPTSKVVGDMALLMVTSGLTRAEVEDPDTDVAFPESVVSLFRGDLGQPHGGFPPQLQRKVLQGQTPLTVRPGAVLPSTDIAAARREAEHKVDRHITDEELASYLMYPDVFVEYAQMRRQYGDLTVLPTWAFFYGMEAGQEISVELDPGRSLIIRYLGVSDHHDDGQRTAFFELNGQPRQIKVDDLSQAATRAPRRQAEAGNGNHVGAPMPGLIAQIAVRAGEEVRRGDTLLTIEAMKMQTSVRAERDGRLAEVAVQVGTQVDAKDLLVIFA
jgi:pyruvate carboxylase